MADQKKSGTAMPFIVGGLVVAVAIIAYVLFAGNTADTETGAAADNAADAIGDAADNAADTIDDAAESVEENTGN